MAKQLFKGIKSVLGTSFAEVSAEERKGYIWFVRTIPTTEEDSDADAEGNQGDGNLANDEYDIYFGTKHYAHYQEGQFEALETKISEVAGDASAVATALEKVAALINAGEDYNSITVMGESYDTLADAFAKVTERLDSDVAALKTKVSTLEVTVGDAESGLVKRVADLEGIDHDAYVLGTTYEAKVKELEDAIAAKVAQADYDAKVAEIEEALAEKAVAADVAAELAKKVDAVEGSRLMTEAEGTKLEGIEAGAQVNKIEVVKVNGSAVTIADADKSVDITIPSAPVQGVADDEKVLALDGDKLKTTLNLAYVAATEDTNAVLRLTGINGEVVSSIDATAFVKDGMLEGAALEGPTGEETGTKYLVLTFNTAAGKENIRMDVSDLLDYYYAGDGLQLSDSKSFSIKLDETSNKYLQVTTNGLAVSQEFINKINELDNAVLASAKEYADGLNTAMDTRIAALEAIDHDHENKDVLDGITAEKVAAWDAAEQNAKDYADETFVAKEGYVAYSAEEKEKLAGIAAGAQVNVIESVSVNGQEATITGTKAAVTVTSDKMQLGTAITTDGEAAGEGNIAYAADAYIPTVLQGIYQSIRSAVAGGVNSVTANDTSIEVNSADANNPKVGVKVEAASDTTVADGHIALVKGADGLYGMMYYDGDDAEVVA